MNRLVIFIAVLLACGLIAAGCGGDDDDGDDSVATTETVPAAPTETTDDASGGDAVDVCMEQVRAQIDLVEQLEGDVSDEFRNEIEAVCDDVTTMDEANLALEDMCRLVAEETLPGDEAALEGCETINP